MMIYRCLCSSIFSALLVFSVSTNIFANEIGDIRFKVIGTEVVERVDGINGRYMTWEKVENTKGVIIHLEVSVQKDVTIWSTDFNTRYFHNNKKKLEDRGRSSAMTLAVSSPDDDGAWIVGKYVKTKAKEGTRYIKLLFPLEDDVSKVTLQYSYPLLKDISINRK